VGGAGALTDSAWSPIQLARKSGGQRKSNYIFLQQLLQTPMSLGTPASSRHLYNTDSIELSQMPPGWRRSQEKHARSQLKIAKCAVLRIYTELT